MNPNFQVRATRSVALFALLALSLVQCGKKDDDVTPGGNAIVGTWRFSKFAVKDKEGKVTDQTELIFTLLPCLAQLRMTFKDDGTMSGSGGQACGTNTDVLPDDLTGQSKWSLSNGKLTLTDANGDKETYDVELNGSTMTLSAPDVDDTTGQPTGNTIILTLTKA